MEITYSWKITGLKTQDFEGRPSSIAQVYWEKIGTDSAGNQGKFSGATPFTLDPTDNSGPFKPFEELTEDDVIGWIKGVVVADYELHVNTKIRQQIQETVFPKAEAKLPWATISEDEPTT